MKKMYYLGTFLLFGLILACDDKEIIPPMEDKEMINKQKIEECNKILTTDFVCNFKQDDKTRDGDFDSCEIRIMNDCRINQYTNKSDIEKNLIGEWKLVGHGEGWTINVSQPCGYLTITQSEIISQFTNNYIDTITTHKWEIIETTLYDKPHYVLKTTPNLLMNFGRFEFDRFCEKYLSGNHSTFDDTVYLYKKVK